MEVSIRTRGPVGVVDVAGPAGSDGHLGLRAAFEHEIAAGRRFLVLNLLRASSLDSLTLGEVVACFKRVRQRGGDLRLVVAPDGIVHEILQLTALDRVFAIFGDEAEALAGFSGRPA